MIRDAGPADAGAIAAIYNHAVRETTALWSEGETDAVERAAWIAERQRDGWPVVVAVDAAGGVLGYGSYGPFRARSCYRLTVEHSVYVVPEAQGRGLGRALMAELIARARAAGLHVMVGAVDAANRPSLALHRAMGFAEVGLMPQVGRKFGRWLDLALVQLVLDEGDGDVTQS